ncbi:MAG: type II toxin-antitoxin system VapC family toxin [Caldilineaceae bacterium SB0666_bin_21]|nr:type II toxin-antitoxin system VapC family toxin [Caldilineaceae bacterium SB0665_bin_21]MXZ41308.1 type II toxin-antitoxin system VapC family toxin [Caldilineaceae bacterium SB0666_bin_21]MYC62785.1 type II toxin-antitoxin system VapC family toxin [Caldilineaceae bacterium SB0661_bin_34]
MTQPYGIDTSILVRLITAEPEPDFQHCVNELRILIEEQDAEIFASNQVIGEAYIVLQHHYGISASNACSALVDVLTSGMVAPLNGQSVVLALQASGGPGVFDRLIADGYFHERLETLTLDRQMARLPNVHKLGTGTEMGG